MRLVLQSDGCCLKQPVDFSATCWIFSLYWQAIACGGWVEFGLLVSLRRWFSVLDEELSGMEVRLPANVMVADMALQKIRRITRVFSARSL